MPDGDGAGGNLTEASLVGVWRLLRFVARDQEGGGEEFLYGENPKGYIVYTPGGRIIVAFMAEGREPIPGGDVQGGSDRDRARAMDSFNAYTGTYRVNGDTVLHQVEVALLPNWVGGTQLRHVRLEGDRLELSSDPMLRKGRSRTVHLTWERAERW